MTKKYSLGQWLRFLSAAAPTSARWQTPAARAAQRRLATFAKVRLLASLGALSSKPFTVTDDSIKKVMDKFDRNKVDMVIDYEHQTLNKATNGQPAPAAGWFKGLEWRDGLGLFMVQIEWTERAREMIASGEYRYLSPVFGFDSQTGAVTYVHSVALTNDPALIGLSDLAAATAAPHKPEAPHATISAEDREKLKHVFGDLPGLDMDAVIAAALAAPSKASTPADPISEEDRAKLKHVFGSIPGAGGSGVQ